ncbi:hypothetical protein J2W27_004490 [Variovorax boronicumulans]|uniref:nucleotidyl transferase AbiEii/AbiGii toxin family protein n=1 Tax=Variovorax boronicumulans TaxID=436515 RepID=UPI00277E012F|nr:nucleotidyl transferase AbiEii/AbiGii toxin family protein [Variovorax boronicumulans]MDP9912364.1 hypothetical protein [Variovorax boronicumulans]
MTKVDFSREGPWRSLWPKALGLMSHLEHVTVQPQWTFGGGTVLMLRFDHRFSKDIDLFVPDLQYLGHVNPRLGGPAEDLTSEYEENAEFIKLEPEAIEIARPFMKRHAVAFLQRLDARAEMAETEFEQIDARSFRMSFWECLVLADAILDPL